ncbi:MAG: hypothetical protein CMQ50_06925 [Gammaproteobacteria bacterium]|nr:hypothetical protein [Gammaproteobacteria bacterium]HCP49338.1 hypothetical protein [Gammaproteobacteria bacterium]|tara:strand:- start:176 stop:355 length:180 start_codon:yes stop_codon:yes gene_type:complete
MGWEAYKRRSEQSNVLSRWVIEQMARLLGDGLSDRMLAELAENHFFGLDWAYLERIQNV